MATLIRHDYLMGAYRALYEDLIRWIPSANRKALEWDLVSLERLVLNRGDRYVTIDLPEFGKFFESALDSGSLRACAVPGFGRLRCKRGKDMRPRLFWALLSRVFRFDGTLRKDPCTTSILFLRQLCYLFKKYKGECRDEYKFAAIRDLYVVEEELRPPSLDWETPLDSSPMASRLHLDDVGRDLPDPSGSTCRRDARGRTRLEVVQQVMDLLAGILPEFDPNALFGRHGPGSVSDASWRESKYSFPVWPDKLEPIFPFDLHGSSCFGQDGLWSRGGSCHSKLIAVPKTHKGPRLIASEPVANQWIQQGMMSYFIDAFESLFLREAIRIDDQSLNQERARLASFGTGATIDLSSASDRLSCFVVERAFRKRPDLLSAMMACRTSVLRNDLDRKFPASLAIKKFAMMGSALTFPVQTFVFFAIASASVLWVRGRRVSIAELTRVCKEVSVYGDDLIVPKDSAETLCSNLATLGLKVNLSKSFWNGYFRESCGADWYKGENVTPCYIRDDFDPKRPSTVSTMLEVSNNLHKCGFWVLSAFVLHRLPPRVLAKLPVEDGSLAIKGIFSFVGTKLDHLRRRFNERLHRDEVRILALTSKVKAPHPDGIYRLRQYFVESRYRLLRMVHIPESIRYMFPSEYDPRTSGRSVPACRERYVGLY